MAATTIDTLESQFDPHGRDQALPAQSGVTAAQRYELLILAFAHCAHAELVVHRLGRLCQTGWPSHAGALVLTRDACGAAGITEEGDFVERFGSLPASVRGILLRLLPGPLSVLSGGSTYPPISGSDSDDPLSSTADVGWLARHLAVNSSAALLLVERSTLETVLQSLEQVEMAARSSRLQVSLDDNIEHFAARVEPERLRVVCH